MKLKKPAKKARGPYKRHERDYGSLKKFWEENYIRMKPTDEGLMVRKEKLVERIERALVKRYLSRADRCVSQAARLARMDRGNFLRLMRKHKLKGLRSRSAHLKWLKEPLCSD